MTAELLRRAASKAREVAEAATPGPWSVQHVRESAVANQHIIERWFVMGCFDGDPRNPTGPAAMSEYEPDAAHITLWHPGVALAVADWLDGVALFVEAKDDEEYFDLDGDPIAPEDTHAIGSALTVARLLLGEAS